LTQPGRAHRVIPALLFPWIQHLKEGEDIMARTLTDEEKRKIRDDVIGFLAEEFEVDPADIKDESSVVDDLGGDSILFIEMIDEFKEKYGIDLEVRVIGQYMLNKRISTVGETIASIYEIIEKGEELLDHADEG